MCVQKEGEHVHGKVRAGGRPTCTAECNLNGKSEDEEEGQEERVCVCRYEREAEEVTGKDVMYTPQDGAWAVESFLKMWKVTVDDSDEVSIPTL
jgi:hypothetical protein